MAVVAVGWVRGVAVESSTTVEAVLVVEGSWVGSEVDTSSLIVAD